METIFINTENSKKNESNKLFYEFNDKLNLKNENKNIIFTHGKTLNLRRISINLKYLLRFGMINLIYLIEYSISDIQDYFE